MVGKRKRNLIGRKIYPESESGTGSDGFGERMRERSSPKCTRDESAIEACQGKNITSDKIHFSCNFSSTHSDSPFTSVSPM
jgi:hypothetical protein